MSFINELDSYIFTGNKTLCTGCGACAQICKHRALKMMPDEEGFLYPKLNSENCVECGLCNSICPVTGSNKENEDYDTHCFVATTSYKNYYKDSASIGICTMLSESIIKQNGYVFGAYLDETSWTAYHILINSDIGIQKIRNSKYLQSTTKDTFIQARKLLIEGSIVLYIGTPCQIAGLKSFLRKDYPNLYTIDLICHGVFSPRLMPLEIGYWEKKFKGKVTNFKFRSKKVYKYVNGGMVNFDLQRDGGIRHIERFAASSPTYRCYAYSGDGNHYNHRLSCYSCHFRSQKRYGDLTVGDPWFIVNGALHSKILSSSNPVRSLYFVNSEKGERLIGAIRNNLIVEEISQSDAFRQPALLASKNVVPEKRRDLFSLIGSMEYGKTVEKLLDCNLEDAHKFFVCSYRKDEIKRMIKKLLFK